MSDLAKDVREPLPDYGTVIGGARQYDPDGMDLLSRLIHRLYRNGIALADEVERLREANQEYRQLIDLQHSRTVEADRAWQLAHNKPHVIPDLGRLVEWLMESRGLHDRIEAAMPEILRLLNSNEPFIEALKEFRVLFGLVNKWRCACGYESDSIIIGGGCPKCGGRDHTIVVVREG